MDLVFLALCLILPVSALLARRLPIGETVKMALGWVAIFGILFIVIALWQGAANTGAGLSGLFQ
ncbi:hypothetical protein U1872_03025 [Sphingomonas sp. RB3P16]|uniref:hypothetical protein n=1 Tax=Parasphingomonas frigoris TaxID=3096163 RepID=UPI002FC8672F